MVERRIDLATYKEQMDSFVLGEIRQQSEVNDTLEWILKEKVEENTSHHDADDVAETELEHLVELHKEAIWQLTIDELDSQRGNQCGFKREFAKNSENSPAHESLAEGEATRPEDEQDEPDASDVGRPSQSEVHHVLSLGPAVGLGDGRVTDKEVDHDEQEAEREHDDMRPGASMDIVDDRVLCLAALLVWDASKVKNLHIEKGCRYSKGEVVELHERFLEHVGKQVPILLSEGTGSQTILDTA